MVHGWSIFYSYLYTDVWGLIDSVGADAFIEGLKGKELFDKRVV